MSRWSTILHISLCFLMSMMGACLVLSAASPHGMGLSPDSAHYLATARHLARGDGFVSFGRTPFVEWPPLYPLVLSCFEVGGIDSERAACAINAVLLACCIFLTALATHNAWPNDWKLSLGAAATALVAWPVAQVAMFVWSDTLFIALCLAFLVLLQANGSYPTGRVILLGVLAGAAWLTRYVGCAIVLAGTVTILWMGNGTLRLRVKQCLLFAGLSATPMLLWFWHNTKVWAFPFGQRSPSESTLSMNIRETLQIGSAWVLPGAWKQPITSYWPIGCVIVFLIGTLALMYARRRTLGACAPLVAFVACYLSVLLAAKTLIHVGAGDRLLAPLFLPAVVLVLIALRFWLGATHGRRLSKWASTGMAILLLAWWFAAARNIGFLVQHAHNEGLPYRGLPWRESSMLCFVREELPAGIILSNDPVEVYLYTRRDCLSLPSRTPRPAFRDALNMLAVAKEKNQAMFVVWLGAIDEDALRQESSSGRSHDVLARFDDGIVMSNAP
jgi:hypothetical protein